MKLMRTACAAVALAALLLATPAQASHIWVMDISVNGVALDSTSGATNPTIVASVGDSLDIKAGFYDYCGGGCAENWLMHLQQGGGSLSLSDPAVQFIGPGNGPGSPVYSTFSVLLTTPGSWNGFVQPIQSESCPSYHGPFGEDFGSGGCGGPSVSLPFSLDVNSVPEPATLVLFGGGLAVGAFRRRRKA